MAKFQRGQSMVEFAIVLPFFLFACGIFIVMALMFADYVQVQTEVRAITRACSVMKDDTTAKRDIVAEYRKNNENKTELPLLLYHCDINTSDMTIEYRRGDSEDDNGYWTVTLIASPKDTDSGLWALAYKVDKSAVPTFKPHCTMYSENNVYELKNNQNNNNPGR